MGTGTSGVRIARAAFTITVGGLAAGTTCRGLAGMASKSWWLLGPGEASFGATVFLNQTREALRAVAGTYLRLCFDGTAMAKRFGIVPWSLVSVGNLSHFL